MPFFRIAKVSRKNFHQIPPGQLIGYTGNDPIAAKVFPLDRNAPAIAVKPDGSSYSWDKDKQTWDV